MDENSARANAGSRTLCNLPNFLTLLRIIGVIPLILFIRWNAFWPSLGALLLFLPLAATDYFDGRMARKWGQVTTLGKFIDPLADKLFLIFPLAFLVHQSLFIEFSLLAFYEVCLFLMVCIALVWPENGVVNLGANIFGKIKIWPEGLLIILFLAERLGGISVPVYVSQGLFAAAISLAMASGLGHLR